MTPLREDFESRSLYFVSDYPHRVTGETTSYLVVLVVLKTLDVSDMRFMSLETGPRLVLVFRGEGSGWDVG